MISQILRDRLSKSTFARDVVTLATGTATAQVIGLVFTPWLTRLYSPEAFGVASVWASALAILAIMVCGRFEIAIVLPVEDSDAINLVVLSVAVAGATTALTVLLVWFIGPSFARLVNAPDVYPWLWLIPPSVLAIGCYQSLNYWFTRKKTFRAVAASQLVQSSTTNTLQAGMGSIGSAGAGGLIIGRVVGHLASALFLLRQFWRTTWPKHREEVNLQAMRQVGKDFSAFPRMLLAAHVLNTISIQLPVFFVSHTSIALLGLFTLAIRLLGVPTVLIATSIGQVFYADAAREYEELGSCQDIYGRTLRKLVLLSLITFTPILFIDDSVYAIIFGSNWEGFAEVVRGLVPLYVFRTIASPLTNVFMVVRRTDLYLTFQVAYLLGAFGALVLGYQFGGGLYYIYCYTAVMSLVSVANVAMTYRMAIVTKTNLP